MTRNPPSYFLRNPRSHSMESASKWLVGSSRMRVSASGEKDAGEFDAAALATGEGAEGTLHDVLGEAEAVGHGDGLGLCGIAAGLVEVLHGLVVPGHGLAHHVRIRVGSYPFRPCGCG